MRAGAATPTKITMAIGGYTFAFLPILVAKSQGFFAD
jgi:ABC-type nitrate/sulfonate/bicarbonate transport system substrate-binding protein